MTKEKAKEEPEISEYQEFVLSNPASFTDGLLAASGIAGIWGLIAIMLQWSLNIYFDSWASIAVLVTIMIVVTVISRFVELRDRS